jgi:hypothetical protein
MKHMTMETDHTSDWLKEESNTEWTQSKECEGVKSIIDPNLMTSGRVDRSVDIIDPNLKTSGRVDIDDLSQITPQT